MLFKNHDKESKDSIRLNDIISQKTVNSVLYSDPFLKAGFFSKLVKETKTGVLYVDLDLLYSGYVTSGIIALPENLTLYRPTEDTIGEIMTEILVKASTSEVLIIIDSINGLFNMLNYKKDVGRAVASIVMLLSSIIYKTKSSLVIASMARYKKEEGWVLSTTGKRVVETKNSKKILLERGREGIVVNLPSDSGKILLPAESIPL